MLLITTVRYAVGTNNSAFLGIDEALQASSRSHNKKDGMEQRSIDISLKLISNQAMIHQSSHRQSLVYVDEWWLNSPC